MFIFGEKHCNKKDHGLAAVFECEEAWGFSARWALRLKTHAGLLQVKSHTSPGRTTKSATSPTCRNTEGLPRLCETQKRRFFQETVPLKKFVQQKIKYQLWQRWSQIWNVMKLKPAEFHVDERDCTVDLSKEIREVSKVVVHRPSLMKQSGSTILLMLFNSYS